MEESALDTSGLATHDTIPALPSLLYSTVLRFTGTRAESSNVQAAIV